MPNNPQSGATILVLSDDEEVRDGVAKLLEADGYRIHPVRNEKDAIATGVREQPDLILVSLNPPGDGVTASARGVRAGAGLSQNIPIVMFCTPTVEEGEEVALGENTYATWPADFNQLREFLGRLLVGPGLRRENTPLA